MIMNELLPDVASILVIEDDAGEFCRTDTVSDLDPVGDGLTTRRKNRRRQDGCGGFWIPESLIKTG